LIADAHLSGPGAAPAAFHNRYELGDAGARYRSALGLCVREGADALALLGDISHLGQAGALEEGLGLAAGTGLPVWAVPGNHDAAEREDALALAAGRVGAGNVRLASGRGEAVGEELRVAGLSLRSGDGGFTARSVGGPEVEAWGDGVVLLLTHYPMVSLAARVAGAGLKYAGDLGDLAEAARPLLGRRAPTVVAHGHLHVRDAVAAGSVLQVSCAALIEPPFELNLLEVVLGGGRTVVVRRRAVAAAPSAPGAGLPVLSPAEGAWAFGGGYWARAEEAASTEEEAAG
jgi:3',5'-cyclic AMP phosphodiesterase CpdA